MTSTALAQPESGQLRPTLELVPSTPHVRAPLSPGDALHLARTLKAIADPARLRLLSLIAAHKNGEAFVGELTEPLGLSQPTVSHHLRVLVEAGLLRREKRGVWAYFTVVRTALDGVATLLVRTGNPGPPTSA
jgi:ArsR family transcriptional regulator, arsenate/arsenite/antimonite-responsive transcriptional repressor